MKLLSVNKILQGYLYLLRQQDLSGNAKVKAGREEKLMEREAQERQEETQMCWESGEDQTSFTLFPNQPVGSSIQEVSF